MRLLVLRLWEREALLVLFLCLIPQIIIGGVTSCFVVSPSIRHYRYAPIISEASPPTRQLFMSQNNDLDKNNNNNNNSEESSSSNADWLESLRARQSELDALEQERSKRWRKADCESGVAAVIPHDWVRRLDVDYPLVACGSASGAIYVYNLERGDIVATTAGFVSDEDDDDDHNEAIEPENLQQTLRLLFGSFDGGGTIAIAFSGTLICEAGRAGGVKLWRLDTKTGQIVSQGSIKALDGVLVSALHLGEEYLWVGTADGHLQGYPLEDDFPLPLRLKPEKSWNVGSPLVSMHINSELACAVVTTSSGSVEVISLDDDESKRSIGSFFPPFDSPERRASNAYALSATVVAHKSDKNGDDVAAYSIACGGNDGSLFLQPLAMDKFGEVDVTRPFQKRLRSVKPRHLCSLKCLASPAPGLLITAGLDGSMRVWDIDKKHCLYQFVGYKVWLGSLWTDGIRIVSDGADNTVIMHDFDKSSSRRKQKKKPE